MCSRRPRAQLLLWFILQGRLNTKDRLFKLGFPDVEDNLCAFCKEHPETVSHIIFGCKYSSSLWYFFCSCWNISLCLLMDSVLCFLSWLNTPFYKLDKKIWTSLFYVVSWSIWWLRNEVTFEKTEPNWDIEKKLILWRLGSWTKARGLGFSILPSQMSEELPKVRRWTGKG